MNQKPHKTLRSLLGVTFSVLVLSILGIFILSHLRSSRTLQARKQLVQEEKEGRKVEVAEAKRSEAQKQISLIGESRPFYSVTLYARVSGYMSDLFVDIGDSVKKGQLLARVQSPEAEQAYQSAKANSINLKKISDRNRILLKRKLISQQEADLAFANARVAEANLLTQRVIKNYQEILAPFDGQVIERFVDPGALLQNASGSQSASQPLFTISQLNRLRIFVYVDQKDAASVRVGDVVEVNLPHEPHVRMKATVDQISGQLDPKTRTLLVEIHLDNDSEKIVPGSFLQVKMFIQVPSYLELPAQALVIKNKETLVPIIQSNGHVLYQKVVIVENNGHSILIREGLKEGTRVALNVGSSLTDGQKVHFTEVAKDSSLAGIAAPEHKAESK